MIEANEYSMAQLEEILSALDGQKRNPCSKKAAVKAINKKVTEMGLAAEDVFATVDLLLSGAMTHEEWRASLIAKVPTAEEEQETIEQIRAKQDRFLATVAGLDAAAEEPEEAYIIHNTGPLAEDEVPIEHLTLSKKGKKAVAEKTSKPRENSKQARVIEMLRRPEGATVLQISEEMGWLKHTTRAFVSATLGKKLGLNVTSGRINGRRVYRIED